MVTFFDISLGVRLNSMKKHMTLFLCLSACLLIVIIVLIKPNSFGVLANHIEDDARAKQKIDNAWRVSQTANDKIAAMIFFSEALDDYKFSIYIKHNWVHSVIIFPMVAHVVQLWMEFNVFHMAIKVLP